MRISVTAVCHQAKKQGPSLPSTLTSGIFSVAGSIFPPPLSSSLCYLFHRLRIIPHVKWRVQINRTLIHAKVVQIDVNV
ncbi:hypothetical protein MRB53_025661 [Persea americana]|uniref:Uncharacterized protein n=1 Tax=Persea americana TaxID=3435 RepID=A0ACC2LFS9_PERAE|nr:hypothetical protein MRB53_025661 [Persea americana]